MTKFAKNFEVQKLGSKEGPVLLMSGAIMEHSVFPLELIERVQLLTFDMKELTRINSSGLRLWVQWMHGIKALAPQAVIVLRHCPRFFVEVLNSVKVAVPAPFLVQSFYVPFYCEDCQDQTNLLLVRQKDFSEVSDNPEKVTIKPPMCGACNIQMQPDIFPESYFSFLKSVKDSLAKV